ncbi:bifunctional phosphatidyl-N-methylethanolamine N-methyltransferase/phosphatidyl-N-dimethylethanolamine N-methyltransferase [Maudiozyma humilis]|uniref:Phosphatidyl-N-methylethanolamine N-methyltransferase n=1 Tax=Maudiozyma humilis TaxID=51915 RepID=A0AAV5RWH4_MAUHU|nr:bifunctional phosphatidyl-N-methylethanolamine N-methyltransferase/phosphatidyl-N-dimethylethanolamine N-methyltransferase [Kazachstania humilis]
MNSTVASPDTLLAQCQVVYDSLLLSIDFSEPRFRCALACVAFNPIFWNIAARLEYSTHILTKIAGGAKRGCYLLALTIFSLGIGRDYMYEQALRLQDTSPYMQCDALVYLGYAAIGLGQLLVLTSMYQLGITGTYLGDYFGILMDSRVTAFPFNVSNNPMYQGSTLSFLGMALVAGKPAGLVVAAAVHLMYAIALWFEEPFTAKIYARRDQQRGDKKLQ